MALFTDGPLNALIDLQNYENRILDVSSAEGIDLAGKMVLAQDDIANELLIFLLKRLPSGDYQYLPSPAFRQKMGVSDVVVTKPLREWHAHKTLAFIYRDAYYNQLNDRYQGKWNQYEKLAKASSQNYFRIGVGIVAGPIPRATAPIVSTIAGAGLAATYYAAITWVNQGGQEGSPSQVVQNTTSAGQQLVIAAMNPPANVAGWNVYVGEAPSVLRRQNETPVGIAGTWVLAMPPSPGAPPCDGQNPNWYVVDHQAIERG